MNLIVKLLLFAVLLWPLTGRAQEVEVSVGLVCDTPLQVASYLDKYTTPAETLAAVNQEANDPNACIIARVAYVQGAVLTEVRTPKGAFKVIEIVVVGVETARGMMQLVPALFYSMLRVNEQGA